MSFGVAVNELDFAGPGQQYVQANLWFKVESQPIVVIGDLVTSHGDYPSPPPMIDGCPWYRVGGTGVSRAGHRAACLHQTTGRPWYRIGAGTVTP